MVNKNQQTFSTSVIQKGLSVPFSILASASLFSGAFLARLDSASAINIVIDSFTDASRVRNAGGTISTAGTPLLGATTNPNAFNTVTSIAPIRGQGFEITAGAIDALSQLDVLSASGSFRTGSDNSGTTIYSYRSLARWAGATAAGAAAFGTQGTLTLDLTSGGTNQAVFLTKTNQSSVQPGSNIALTIFDGITSQTVSTNIDATGTQNLYSFNFSDFGAVNLTTVSAIELRTSLVNVNQGVATNFNFQTLEAAPIPFDFEPTSGLAILGAGFGLNKLRKTLKAKQETKV